MELSWDWCKGWMRNWGHSARKLSGEKNIWIISKIYTKYLFVALTIYLPGRPQRERERERENCELERSYAQCKPTLTSWHISSSKSRGRVSIALAITAVFSTSLWSSSALWSGTCLPFYIFGGKTEIKNKVANEIINKGDRCYCTSPKQTHLCTYVTACMRIILLARNVLWGTADTRVQKTSHQHGTWNTCEIFAVKCSDRITLARVEYIILED